MTIRSCHWSLLAAALLNDYLSSSLSLSLLLLVHQLFSLVAKLCIPVCTFKWPPLYRRRLLLLLLLSPLKQPPKRTIKQLKRKHCTVCVPSLQRTKEHTGRNNASRAGETSDKNNNRTNNKMRSEQISLKPLSLSLPLSLHANVTHKALSHCT